MCSMFVSQRFELQKHSTDLTDIIPFPVPKEQTPVELLVFPIIDSNVKDFLDVNNLSCEKDNIYSQGQGHD